MPGRPIPGIFDSMMDPTRTEEPTPRTTRALIMLAAVGGLVAVSLGVYGRLHEPTGVAISLLGFDSILAMKSWLTNGAIALGIVQVVTAAGMWGRLRGWSPSWLAPLHQVSGLAAFLLTLPVAYTCLWSLGFSTFSLRSTVHSVLGCAFYGVFVAKMLALRLRNLPGLTLPVLGGTLFAVLALVWASSSLWFFTGVG